MKSLCYKITFSTILLLSLSTLIFGQKRQAQIDSLTQAYKKSTLAEDKVETLFNLIDVYNAENRDSARTYIDISLKLAQENKLKTQTSLALLKKAQYYIVDGKYDSSAVYYDKAWDRLKEDYDYDLYTKYYGDRGILNFYQGDFKAAKISFEKALEMAKDAQNEEDQLRFLNNTALAMSYLGEAQPSIAVHQNAIALAEKLNDSTSLGKSFNNLGLIYEDMKEYEKALEFYEKSLLIKENSNSLVDIVNSKYNAASMYKEIGEQKDDTSMYVIAEKKYMEVLEDARAIDYGKVQLFVQTALAQLATVRGNPKKAIRIYEEALASAKETNDNQVLRVTYLNLGVNYLKLNNTRKAEEYLSQAKPLIEESENPSDMASLYKNLAELYTEKGEFKAANEMLLKQIQIEKNMASENLQQSISDFEVKYETEKKENEILEQRAQLAEKDLEVRRKNTIIYGSLGLALVLGLLGYLFYNQQKLKNRQLQKESELKTALARIETQNKLQEQRLRISRDLHDNIGAQLTFIISSIDNLKYGFPDMKEKLSSKLSSLSTFTSQTIYELRDTIWAMNKNDISFEDLNARISNFITSAKEASEQIDFSFNISPNINPEFTFTSVQGMNIYRIIQEAVNNSLKYADASKVSVDISEKDNKFHIKVSDDGKGFDIDNVALGNGQNNMKKRAMEINAKLKLQSEIAKGTQLHLIIQK